MTRTGVGIAEAASVYRGTWPAQRQQQWWWFVLRPGRWCPSCSNKISADRGPRFIFSSNNPSNNPSSNPSNFDGHQASLQKIIRSTELLFLLPPIKLSLHPTVLQKRPRYVQCSRKNASTCLPLPPAVNT